MTEYVTETKVHCIDDDGERFLTAEMDGDCVKLKLFDNEFVLTLDMFDVAVAALINLQEHVIG